jgi:hypothetical protein
MSSSMPAERKQNKLLLRIPIFCATSRFKEVEVFTLSSLILGDRGCYV